jgi:hypothetical protein
MLLLLSLARRFPSMTGNPIIVKNADRQMYKFTLPHPMKSAQVFYPPRATAATPQRLPGRFWNSSSSKPAAARLADAVAHSAHSGVPSFSEGMGVGA